MLILFLIAAGMSCAIYPFILKIAKSKNLVDNPGHRKLQKQPVPVLGGLVVFFGIVVALCFFKTIVSHVNIFSSVCAMMVMLYLGCIDDILDIRVWVKFLVEILVCILILYGTHDLMINFQGLFGMDRLPVAVAIPFTIIGMVGIINAINMIDGVDGLSSGMCIFICGCLSLVLFLAHEYSYCALGVVCVGALVPFFFHNVFGKETKMYIGDGGALMLGIAISSMIINITKGREFTYPHFVPDMSDFSLLAFSLAVVSIPVFDTLRVMVVRIFHGGRPFVADRNHLHHLLQDYAGLSPVKTALTEIGMDAFVVTLWFVSFLLGASITLQFIIAFAAGLTATAGTAAVIKVARTFSS